MFRVPDSVLSNKGSERNCWHEAFFSCMFEHIQCMHSILVKYNDLHPDDSSQMNGQYLGGGFYHSEAESSNTN